MRTFTKFLIFIALGTLIYLSFSTLTPTKDYYGSDKAEDFSLTRALQHVKKVAQEPHSIGTEAHSKVRNYLVQELQKLGLEVHTQKAYNLNAEGIFTAPQNIIAKIPGTNPSSNNDLLVLTHYDSAVHSSYGASDAASGLAVILEGIRTLKAQQKNFKNNIIICFSDAEEIGLNGAEIFVKKHPWAENIGLVINFEARGSGGPSNTIIETNTGNAKLVEAFQNADIPYPLATSLMYSVYKVLPNSTDATVFRENKNIPSFFFAFIDDHYDYHTANDTYERLDRKSLAHQASYFLHMIPYFANTDLKSLTTKEDYVYFNFPIAHFVKYPFSYITPMVFLAWISFIGLIIYGFRKNKLSVRGIGKGFLNFGLALLTLVLVGVFGWKLMLLLNPEYVENLQGFTSNGHVYIAMFVCLSIAIIFFIYRKKFKNPTDRNSYFITPLFLWLLINTGIAIYFKGAAYFIIPVFFALFSLWILFRQKQPNLWLLLLLGIPAIFIFSPLIQFFPIALGLKMLSITTLLCLLLFGLLWPIFANYNKKHFISFMALMACGFFFIKAQTKASFSEENQKPNSLIYLADINKTKAYWCSYDQVLDTYTKRFLTEESLMQNTDNRVFHSKYNSGFTFVQPTEYINIPKAYIEIKSDVDSINKGYTNYRLKILPKRNINRMELLLDRNDTLTKVKANGEAQKQLPAKAYKSFLTYYAVDKDTLNLSFSLKNNKPAKLSIYEASNDLLDNPWVHVPPRNKDMMPKPFVLNDAIITKQEIALP